MDITPNEIFENMLRRSNMCIDVHGENFENFV